MKKILGLAAGFLLTIATYAQGVTFTDANESYNKATTQSFHFSFNSSFTMDEINKSGAFYTGYFTVTPVASSTGHDVTITLVEDSEMARRVVQRFFITLSVETISVNGADIAVEEFVSQYIML